MTPEARLARALDAAHETSPFERLWVAVSGGGDSTALLHMVMDWARGAHVAVSAVTVDHGLRADAGDEARGVAAACATLGIPHETRCWGGWDGTGNLQAAARAARYDLIADAVATAGGTGPVLLAHTRDDIAETFVMRLARGSGVDGLSTMAADWGDRGLRWLRPLLEVERAELRGWLTARGIGWVEDPSNRDDSFDRVRVRGALSDLGIDTGRITATAANMASARAALRHFAHVSARQTARVEQGDVVFDTQAFDALPQETRFRLFAHALRWVATATYRPRQTSLEAALAQTGKTTLAGCLVSRGDDHIRVSREYAKVVDLEAPVGAPWDHRWQVHAPEGLDTKGYRVGSLGPKGLNSITDWRETGARRDTLLATPAVWWGETLVAAPLAGLPAGWSADLRPPWGDFAASLLSH